MCFLEFIGYTCGHISFPVLRPCPLTTASHTFPTCPRRADKPFLAGEMCSACQKIVHSRATQIEEYEHRFMHERGACGCDTVFPYLIRPRVIGGGVRGHHGTDATEATDTTDNTGNIDNTNTDAVFTAGTDGSRLPPLLCEAVGEGGRAMVAVRLPSLFAAEWVADHRERHGAGLCHCRVDFRSYREAMEDGKKKGAERCDGTTMGAVDDNDNRSGVDGEVERLPRPRHPCPQPRRTASMSSMPRDEAHGNSGMLRHSSSHGDLSRLSADSGGYPAAVSDNSESSALAKCTEEDSVGLSMDTLPVTSGTHCAAVPACAGRAVRFAGAVFAAVPEYLPLTGPFLTQPPSACALDSGQALVVDGMLEVDGIGRLETGENGEAGKGCNANSPPLPHASSASVGRGRSFVQSVASLKQLHVRQALEKDPLVGLPLGAGPEGASHALPWCSKPPCWAQS